MSLLEAIVIDGASAPVLPVGPPYSCAELDAWRGCRFELNPGDPRLLDIHRGGPAPIAAFDNLVGAVRGWTEYPEWMDFLRAKSPNYAVKQAELALYMDRWADWIPPGCRVLDLGGGIGRFTQPVLDLGCAVELVDPDLRSLWAALDHAVGRPGRLDLHWTTAELLPVVPPVDVVVLAEVLCYVADPMAALASARTLLAPGGVILASVESRWGWAMSPDVAAGTLDAFIDDGVIHVPGDRWVQTYTESDVRELFTGFEIVEIVPSHYVLSGPFEHAAQCPLDLEVVRTQEAALRAHPVAASLNRAWSVVARSDTVQGQG